MIDLSYPLEKALTSGDIDGILENYGKSLVTAQKLLPHVSDPKLRAILSERITDFEKLVGKLRSGEKNVNNIQGILNRISNTLATTLQQVVGAVHSVVKGVLDTIFSILHLKH